MISANTVLTAQTKQEKYNEYEFTPRNWGDEIEKLLGLIRITKMGHHLLVLGLLPQALQRVQLPKSQHCIDHQK